VYRIVAVQQEPKSHTGVKAGDEPAPRRGGSALAGLESTLDLIDYIKPPFAAHQTVGAVATAQRFQ